VPAHRVTATIEDEALRVLVAHPDEVAGVLRPVLFASRAHRGAAEALLAGDGLHAAMAAADPEAAEVLGEAAVSEPTADPEGVVSRLVDVAATRALRSLEVEARAADDARPYVEAVTWLHARIEDLRERTTRKKALDQLLPWLDEHGEGRVDD
jgi:hypothetical protein